VSRTTSSTYDINDPAKIQGRDEIIPGTRNLGAIRLQRALEALADQPGLLLVPGAGAGRYARALANARPDLDVIAGDLSEQAVCEAVAAGGTPAYLVMDALDLPFPASAFDAVIFFDLLEHVPAPERMLAECARVLRPAGVLHFFVPLEHQPWTIYRALRRDRPIPIHRWKRDHVGHIQRFDRATVVRLTWDAGLEVTHLSHSFHLIGQVHDVVDYWQRERGAGGRGIMPDHVVRLAARGIFAVTWRLAYLEDRLYAGPWFASGLHITAVKPSQVVRTR
jgi:SAM-dependent methyltransferase